MGRRRVSRFRSWCTSKPRPGDGDASLGPILSHRSVVPGFRAKHICSALSVRARRLDVDLADVSFSLAGAKKSCGRFFCGGPAGLFRSVPALCASMPLLRAQPAPGRMVVLRFFQNDISARVFVVHCCGSSAFSQSSLWPCACGRARRLDSYLSTICRAASLDPVCRANDRDSHPAVARALFAFIQRVCPEYDRCAVDRRICRALRPSVRRVHFGHAIDRKCFAADRSVFRL